MKTTPLAFALLGMVAGAAHAQSGVQLYGTIDAGVVKRTGESASIGKRSANTLGFKGVEDLGNGLKAIFQAEIRYEPDTGTVETGPGGERRPLFQGQSRVGLAGGFGTLRIGRGLTPLQETIGNFEPFHAIPTAGGFYTDLSVAGYTSQPLDEPGSSNNRWANALWYNTPVIQGFQVNTAIATRESNRGGAVIGRGSAGNPQYPADAEASANPFSVSATYYHGPAAFMAAYERNAVETKIWSIGASYLATPELKLMATYSRQNQENTRLFNPDTRAWVVGANYALGPGRVLAGVGQKDADGQEKVRQLSVGYEYSLSPRTYLYIDASRKTGLLNGPARVNQYDIGVNHSF